jgi:hypothetical protein
MFFIRRRLKGPNRRLSFESGSARWGSSRGLAMSAAGVALDGLLDMELQTNASKVRVYEGGRELSNPEMMGSRRGRVGSWSAR